MRENSGSDRKTDIIYEDAELVVCIKPRGVLSCADASGKLSMNELLAPRCVFPIHRLDREVNGLMVFAKNERAAAFLSNVDGFVKEYLARCEGEMVGEGEMTDLLYHDRIKNKTYVVKRKRGGVKEARLAYRVLSCEAGESVVHVRLYTGRTHQIRVQFASRGFPLCGDRKYGAKQSGEIGLTAYRLQFIHPNGKAMQFELPE